MKKTILIAGILMSGLSFSQKKDYHFFENNNSEQDYSTARAPGDPGDPVPIDDYIPLLAVAALGLMVWYGKRKYAAGTHKKKRNLGIKAASSSRSCPFFF